MRTSEKPVVRIGATQRRPAPGLREDARRIAAGQQALVFQLYGENPFLDCATVVTKCSIPLCSNYDFVTVYHVC